MQNESWLKKKERMDMSYGLNDKGINHVINFVKLRMTTAGAKISRHNQRNLQYQQKNMFRNDQRQFYKELDERTKLEERDNLCSERVEHNSDSDWLKKAKEKLRDTTKQ